jgi:hypothetical protein
MADHDELRKLAEAARSPWYPLAGGNDDPDARYIAAVSPGVVLGLLDEVDQLSEQAEEQDYIPAHGDRISEYRFRPLTERECRDWWVWDIRVSRVRGDRWAVQSMFEVYGPNGWVHDSETNSDAWVERYSMPLRDALEAAEEAQWTLEINGKTAEDILAKRAQEADHG